MRLPKWPSVHGAGPTGITVLVWATEVPPTRSSPPDGLSKAPQAVRYRHGGRVQSRFQRHAQLPVMRCLSPARL